MGAVRALLIYNGLQAAYLVYLRTLSGYRWTLLLPAILLYAALTLLLIDVYSGDPRSCQFCEFTTRVVFC